MRSSLREQSTSTLHVVDIGKIVILGCAAMCVGISGVFFRGTIFADLRNFGELWVFSRFSYFYSMVFREILHACCIYYLLKFSILNLCFFDTIF